jgi:alkylation response protein AidB-like acyl-CoA dehydrogenase
MFGELNPFGDPYWYADFQSVRPIIFHRSHPQPYYDDSHRAVRRIVRNFVDTEITPYCHEWDEAKQVPRALYGKCAQLGLLAAICGHEAMKVYKGPVIGNLKADQVDPFHEFIVCDELSRCGSGKLVYYFFLLSLLFVYSFLLC